MVTFVFGKSGTGKTHLCINEIVKSLSDSKDTRQLILLVPEQATYQAERAILSKLSNSGLSGYSRLSILSFQRLAMMLTGSSLAQASLSNSAKQMIVTRLLIENADKLKVYSSTAKKPGTASGITRIITELQHYSKTPDDVDALITAFSDDSVYDAQRLKFADINLMYKQYLDFIKDSFVNPDDNLNVAAGAAKDAEFVTGAMLWVDGFAGFTTSELELLIELIKHVSQTKIALCLDGQRVDLNCPEYDMASLFGPTEKTYIQLLDAIRHAKLPIEKPVILESAYRFADSPVLREVERNIFSPSASSGNSDNDEIHIVSAHHNRTEVDFVANEIHRLVRDDGYRWRDIAVISGDIGSYRHYIAATFGDYEIPFFIDTPRAMNQYPAVELITSAMKIACDSFEISDIFSSLKTDLVPVRRDEVDLLENYCLAFGLRANDFKGQKKWDYAQADDRDFNQNKINEIRSRATNDIFEFASVIQACESVTAEKFCEILLNFLDEIGFSRTIEKWTCDADERGDNDSAQMHQQFMVKFPQILGELIDVFQDCPMSPADFASVLSTAFSQMTLALIPPGLDQVLIGSIDRSRHPDLKAVFLVGTIQKTFPSPISYDNILSDSDRATAEEFDFVLSEPTNRKLLDRRYLAYIAFTRPSQRLYITYPAFDSRGSEVHPSGFVEDLQTLFDDLEVKKYYGHDLVGNLYSESALTDILCSRPASQTSEIISQMDNDKNLKQYSDFVKSCYEFKKPAELSADFVENFFDKTYRTSSSQLDSFAACPFSYFSRYMLKLKERRLFEFEPLDLGRFYHSVLENIFKNIKAAGKDLKNCGDDELLDILEHVVEEAKAKDNFLHSFISHSKHNLSIIKSAVAMLSSAILEIAAISRAGSFVQVDSEVSFGLSKSDLSGYAFEISDDRKVEIGGLIDRLDVVRVGDENYALIFDYKLSAKSFDYSKIATGMGMQLLIYILAVDGKTIVGFENLKPVGAFYLPIESWPGVSKKYTQGDNHKIARKPKGFFDGSYYELIDSEIESKWSNYYSFCFSKNDQQYGHYKSSSALKSDDYQNLLEFSRLKITDIAKKILSGDIVATPYKQGNKTPCGYCKFKPVCRFDWQIHSYNEIEKVTKEQLLAQEGSDEQ